jgi:HEAT repeat protein
LRALGRFGPSASPAVPVLIECLDDPDAELAECAFQSLTNVARERVDPEHIVPALTNCLERPNGVRQAAALNALALYYGAARSAVPAIAPFQHDPEVRVRIAATNALQHIAPEMIEGKSRER